MYILYAGGHCAVHHMPTSLSIPKDQQQQVPNEDGNHVINDDDVTHSPKMANGISEDQPHLSDSSSEPHPSNLTNGIHQSEPLQSPTNIVRTSLDESHSDLLSNTIPDLVNGTCSTTEHSEATTSAANSANQNTSGR